MSNFANALIGKTIKAIYPRQDDAWSMKNYSVTEEDISCEGGSIMLEFTDGTAVEVWNSEWGGIRVPEKEGAV